MSMRPNQAEAPTHGAALPVAEAKFDVTLASTCAADRSRVNWSGRSELKSWSGNAVLSRETMRKCTLLHTSASV